MGVSRSGNVETLFAAWTISTLLICGPAAARAQDPLGHWRDPSTWNEWLVPLEEYSPGQPQSASCRIFVREIGAGPTVVVLHGGWGGEHASMLGLLPLAARYRLVFYDQRGSLRSPCERLPTADDHVADLELLRATLGVERVVLLGHSMGGWLAQAYAAAHPERVRALLLLGPTPAIDSLPARTAEARWERPEVLRELDRRGLVLPRRPEDTPQEWAVNHRIIFGAVNLHDITRWRELPVPWFYATDAARSAATSMPDDYDVTGSLARMGAPILVIVGDDDYIPPSSHRSWVPMVPNARLRIVEDAGHFSWIDQPEVVMGVISEFFEEVFRQAR